MVTDFLNYILCNNKTNQTTVIANLCTALVINNYKYKYVLRALIVVAPAPVSGIERNSRLNLE